ncbi:sulfatase-like hydrolase/transferase [bacterium]|nr:sulfatase-like hydrolase/transferase [bacterium]
MRSKFIIVLALCLIGLISILVLRLPEKPNILFVLTDDQRWDTLGCYGNEIIQTPNFDKLAMQGALFENFYIASPFCCPSRAIFLTGLYPHQTGIYDNQSGDLPDGSRTIAHYLNDAGYLTAFIGKAHLGGNPQKWGFQSQPVYLPGWWSKQQNPRLKVEGQNKTVKGNVTAIFADAALRFIEKNKSRTWFLWLATTSPHTPYLTKPRNPYIEKMKAPKGWPVQQAFVEREKWADYYLTISQLDTQLGRVLQKLDELNLSKKTLVIVTSDNGNMLGSHGYQEKGVWFEEAIRVPTLVRWPSKVEKGISVSSLISSVDFVPTILQIAGVAPPSQLKGVSFLPLLTREEPSRSEVFSEGNRAPPEGGGSWQMVRDDRWKYVQFVDHSERHFYDLRKDPFELRNVVDDPVLQQSIHQMQEKITRNLGNRK